MKKYFLFLIICLTTPLLATNTPTGYSINTPPPWVEIKENTDEVVPDHEPYFGIFYHFIDRQAKKEKNTLFNYINISKKIVSQDGIQHSSQIEIEFDPTRETIILHTISVKRGTKTINHLHPKKIRLLQREKELEDNIYSGFKSLNIILDDIRVGDTINYSYTLEEKDLEGKNNFYNRYFFTLSSPISFYQYRLLWPTDRKISLKHHGNMSRPKIVKQGDYTEYRWTRHDMKRFEWEPSTPKSFECRDFVEIGDQLSWSDINESMADLYKNQLPLSPDLQKYITDISKATSDEGQKFMTVMKFAQDNVRYMGMSNLADGHQPEDPSTVFSRRYGDCKDKTFLALTILRSLGIKAYPALVHTSDGENLNKRLPSASIFNHVIIVAFIGSKKYWIDPTQSFQGGRLKNYSQPYNGYALIIDGKSNTLTKMPQIESKEPPIEVLETFDLSKGHNQPSTVTVTTTLKGERADRQRRTLLTTSKKKLQNEYLTYFEKLYPGIQENSEIEITDRKEKNEIKIKESYKIPNIWVRDENQKSWFTTFYFKEITDDLDIADISSSRKMPLLVSFPRHISKKIEVHLPPSGWNLKSNSIHISDPAFKLSQKEIFKNNKGAVLDNA